MPAISSHNTDVLFLKKLVFLDGLEALKGETEKRYHAYRRDELLKAKAWSKQGPEKFSFRRELLDKCRLESEDGAAGIVAVAPRGKAGVSMSLHSFVCPTHCKSPLLSCSD